MKEMIVYLPEPWLADDTSMAGVYVLDAKDVYSALDAAGVKMVMESPEEHQIRMMKLQIEELKGVCAQLQDQNIELRNVCTTLEDQNAALKMTIRRLEDKP